jgi:hypothetical protein
MLARLDLGNGRLLLDRAHAAGLIRYPEWAAFSAELDGIAERDAVVADVEMMATAALAAERRGSDGLARRLASRALALTSDARSTLTGQSE